MTTPARRALLQSRMDRGHNLSTREVRELYEGQPPTRQELNEVYPAPKPYSPHPLAIPSATSGGASTMPLWYN